MKSWIALGFGLAMLSAPALSADSRTLQNLMAPTPASPVSAPSGSAVRPVQLARVVIHPKDGEAWALVYRGSLTAARLGLQHYEGAELSRYLAWNGAGENETAVFQRAFDDELRRSGFQAAGGESVFADAGDSADLKVGVRIDDLAGRFCVDCPSLLHPTSIPGVVVMTAHWEVYSTLERKVVARITTSGGANYMTKLTGNFVPAVSEAFRDNVRLLLANEDFRRTVTTPLSGGSTAPQAPSQAPLAFAAARVSAGIADAGRSVAVVYAADGSGSGFLISPDGYLLTNQHVVGGGKFVKLKWSDGKETLGEVLRVDRRRDVALVKADAGGRAALALRSGPVAPGDAVFAIGTPLGDELQNTLTKGIVSGNRTLEGLPYIQSDVAVTHGNSGGPLLDDKGAVIGMTVSGKQENGVPVSLNFFIPIDDALRALALTPAAAPPPQVAAVPPVPAPAPKRAKR